MDRVWTYTISKPLSAEAQAELVKAGQAFVSGWTAHENKLSANFDIFKNRIVVVKVDENVYGASGCSIDKLLRFVKEAEQHFGIELLNRFLVPYKKGDAVEVVPAQSIKELLAQGAVNEQTVVYNTAVANDTELNNWEQPLKDTWLNKYLS